MLSQSSLILSSVAIILSMGMLDAVNGQTTSRCFTQSQWKDHCYEELKLDNDGDMLASGGEYIALLNNTATSYGIQSRTTKDPPTLFYQLEINLQLPFVTHFCDSLVTLSGGEPGKCYETLESETQTNEVFGFPLNGSAEADAYLRGLCEDIYVPALERQWIAACVEGEEAEELIEDRTETETVSPTNKGPTFIAIGASVGALVLFLGLVYARRKGDNHEDDIEDFQDGTPVDADGNDIPSNDIEAASTTADNVVSVEEPIEP